MLTKKSRSEFGIYFGTNLISITEVDRKKALRNISIPQIRVLAEESKQKNIEENKIVAALKEAFAKNNTPPTSVSLTLPEEDLIIRTFDLPIFLSKRELGFPAITFEAKKHIPFKIDSLVFDFRVYLDQKDKKNLILFVGIKKDVLQRYLSIFKPLEIQIKLIEYAGFSILRLLKLGGIKERGTFLLLNIDLEEETNFVVCEDGFPLFSRDISSSAKLEAEAESVATTRFKNEIRISLDFFRRKFPTKSLDKAIVLASGQAQAEIAALGKDLELSIMPLEASKFLNNDLEFSSALAKSYATAISDISRLSFPINLLRPMIEEGGPSAEEEPVKISDIRINPKVILLVFSLIIFSIALGWVRRIPVERASRIIKENQPKVAGMLGQQALAALVNLEGDYSNRIKELDAVAKNRLYLTEVMDAIPRLMPEGAWLTNLSFQSTKDKLEFKLEGMVSLANPDKEFAVVNDVISGLKNESALSQHFKEIKLVSIERIETKDLEVTKFKIQCQ